MQTQNIQYIKMGEDTQREKKNIKNDISKENIIK